MRVARNWFISLDIDNHVNLRPRLNTYPSHNHNEVIASNKRARYCSTLSTVQSRIGFRDVLLALEEN